MPRRSACLDMLATLRVRDISGVWLVRDEGPIEKRLFGFSVFRFFGFLSRSVSIYLWSGSDPTSPFVKKTKKNNIARLFCICRLGTHITPRPFHISTYFFLLNSHSHHRCNDVGYHLRPCARPLLCFCLSTLACSL